MAGLATVLDVERALAFRFGDGAGIVERDIAMGACGRDGQPGPAQRGDAAAMIADGYHVGEVEQVFGVARPRVVGIAVGEGAVSQIIATGKRIVDGDGVPAEDFGRAQRRQLAQHLQRQQAHLVVHHPLVIHKWALAVGGTDHVEIHQRVQQNAGHGHNTVYDFCLQLWTRGGELLDGQGKWNLQTEEAESALAYYRTILNDRSAVHPDSRGFDSVKSGMAFAGGEVAMMINWFGFAGMAETIAESVVKGKVGIANIPYGVHGRPVSLNAYWILAINAHSPHADMAYRFLRHSASAQMDKLLTLEGGIGCRKSTWTDVEVNAEIPFYHRMVSLHEHARELPRLANWAEIAAVIDELVLQTINTDRPIAALLAEAQNKLEDVLSR